jgi:hypothetical protein
MGFFGWGQKDVVDLTGDYKKPSAKKDSDVSKASGEGDAMRLLGGLANASSQEETEDSEYSEGDYSDSIEERRKKLAKRLGDMTDKMEDLSNQIYHLTQRIELLEKKLKISRAE